MGFRPLDRFVRRRRQKAAFHAFRSLPIREGDIVIDAGANIGSITLELLGRGARILAYEPNPVAFAHLDRAFGQHPQVSCRCRGLYDRNGELPLYLHKRRHQNEMHYSEASSLLSDKQNIDARELVTIQVDDVAEAVASAGKRIRLLKLDIEGAEYPVLHRLMDTGDIHRIDWVFCETHDHKIPSLAGETRRLRQRLAAEGVHHVNLDWQ